MAGKMFEIAFQLAGRVNSSFNSTFQNANQQLEQIDNTASELQENANGLESKLAGVGKAAAGIGLAVGAAGLAVGGLAVNLSDDLQKSLNGVQSATGIADEQMAGMKDTMLAIYNDNFGEGFEDIGASMSTINQQTGLAGEALKETTEDAIALKDTFGLEVADSIKGANQLMKQFGMDGDTAYNLIAQGAQWGLDANGDLLDTLKEYGGTFAAQGFSAEEMFNMLSNASNSGIRDLDLAADAIKEFGIRSKDGSTTSAAGFEALGLNAATMTKAFAIGGETGKKAFDKTTKALFEMKDPVAQNAAGVALFGTQWEDLGVKGVAALVNTQGEISKSVDALGKINAVKYNSFGEAMAGIKRNLETGLLLPIGDKLLPKMSEFSGWITANMPAIQNEISFAMNIVGSAIANVGTAITDTKNFFQEHWNVVSPILAGIGAGAITFGVITLATKAWSEATKLATLAQKGLNLAMNLSPMGKAIAAVSLLVAGGVLLYQNWDTIKTKAAELWESVKSIFSNVAGWFDENVIQPLKNMVPDWLMKLFSGNANATVTVTSDTGAGGIVEEKHAWGGIMTSPHIGLVAEAGPEAIVPLSNRSRGIDVWRQAGQALGVGGGPSQPNVTFAPVIHVSAGDGTNKQEIEDIVKRAVSEAQGNFNQWAQNYQKEQRRLSYV